MAKAEDDNQPKSGAETGSNEDSAKIQLSRVGDVIVISAARPALPEVLSATEQEVVHALLAGQSNAEIARARGTAAKTVSNQIHKIYRKLGVGSRGELVALLTGASPRSPSGAGPRRS